jgi:hypothetical protein
LTQIRTSFNTFPRNSVSNQSFILRTGLHALPTKLISIGIVSIQVVAFLHAFIVVRISVLIVGQVASRIAGIVGCGAIQAVRAFGNACIVSK